MEALVYTFLLIGTLTVIFFAVFFRDTPRILRK
jgi:photosystem II PsbT protein